MVKRIIYNATFVTLAFFYITCLSCQQGNSSVDNIYKYIEPDYKQVQIYPTAEVLKFNLNDTTYNEIKSFNLFSRGAVDYISFYDRRSQSINMYDLKSQNLVKRILLKPLLGNRRLLKTTVYCRGFDSIFISNLDTLYHIDENLQIVKAIPYLREPKYSWAQFENYTPPVFTNTSISVGVRPTIDETSYSALKAWRTMYQIDLSNKKTSLCYPLSEMYRKGLYGDPFLKYGYCYNDRGHFVYSFWADTLIYETNLADYNVSYLGKSSFQKTVNAPMTKNELAGKDDFIKYGTKDCYGAIYYDYATKRYLRVSKSGLTDRNIYATARNRRKQRLIIFDENLRIIGESGIPEDISLNELIITSCGDIYARTKVKDEYAINFVKLQYNQSNNSSGSIDKLVGSNRK